MAHWEILRKLYFWVNANSCTSAQHFVLREAGILHIPAAFHRFQHGDLVGVFDVAADWDTHRDPRYLHARSLKLLREIDGGRFPFDSRVGGEDDFIHMA